MAVEIIGTLAAILTTGSFFPQAIKTWRSGSAQDFSWLWLISFALGLLLWLVYGFMLNSWPLIIANAITLALVVSIAAVKWRG